MPVIVRASLWFVVCSFLQKGISVLTTPIFTRLMDTSEYGQFNVFQSWYGIVEVFVSIELAKGVYSQGIVKYSEDQRLFSSSFQGLNLFLLIVWTLIYFLFRNFFNQLLKLTTVQMLCMLVMIWATAAFELWSTEKRTLLQYRSLVLVTIFTSLLKPLVGILFVLKASDKVTARIFGLMLVEVIAYTGLCVVQIMRGGKIYSKKYWTYALSFNIPLIPHYLSQIVLESSDRIMIESLVSSSAAGIYSLAYQVSMVMRLLNTALNQTIKPWLYKHIKDGKTESIAPVAMMMLCVVAVGNLVLIVFAPEAISVFAPEAFHEAIWVVPPVAMSVYFLYMYNYFACFEFYFEEKKYIGIATIIAAGLNVGLNAAFIPLVGYIAAAYTTLACNILYTAAHYCFMRLALKKYMNGRKVYDLKNMLLLSALFLLSGFALMVLYSYPVLRYSVIAALTAALIVTRKKWIKKAKEISVILKERS